MSNEVMQRPATPNDLLRMAVEQGADLDRLERLMDLQQRWEADQARKAYVIAMRDFKADPPRIMKDKQVEFAKTVYSHAMLATANDAICEALAKHGMSHRWNVSQSDGLISVTCTITHEMGHSESVVMSAGSDNSGAKNSIQAIASTVTYLQRYTLLAIAGLAAHDMQDDDGANDGSSDWLSAIESATDKLGLEAIKTRLRESPSFPSGPARVRVVAAWNERNKALSV